jgi:hypothetical protein
VTYTPPLHIMIRRRTEFISDADLAFVEKALAIQLREASAAYGFKPPGVTFCGENAIVGSNEAAGMDFVDDDGVDGAIAHHGYYAGFPWSLIGCGETFHWELAASHEALEYLVNLRLDQWAAGPDGTRWPMEIADPVESDVYTIPVEIFGETRNVEVSNYVLPAFWREGSEGPWDRMGTLKGPFTLAPGGYAVVEIDGIAVDLYGSGAKSTRHPEFPAARRPGSRAAQIVRAHAAGIRHGARF